MTTTLSKSAAAPDCTRQENVRSESSSPESQAESGVAARELVRWFKLLADETRLRILLFLLQERELNVRTLCEMLSLSQPAVSHHLALLRGDRLIECRRDGKHNFYRISPQRFGDLTEQVLSAVPQVVDHVRVGRFVVSVAPEAGETCHEPAVSGIDQGDCE